MKTFSSVCVIAVLTAVCGSSTSEAEEHWPRFRGPSASGVAPDHEGLPITWTTTKNVKWVADVPGWASNVYVKVSSPPAVGSDPGGEVVALPLPPATSIAPSTTAEPATSNERLGALRRAVGGRPRRATGRALASVETLS